MPFLSSSVESHRNQLREQASNRKHLLAQQESDEANRDFWYKIKFSACLLGGVGLGSFLFFAALFSIMPE